MMTKNSLLVSVLITLFLPACDGRRDGEWLANAFEVATTAYYTKDVRSAEVALLDFVSIVERHAVKLTSVAVPQYKRLLDISWLRLASIYMHIGDSAKYRYAISRAIYYFDQDPDVVSISEYVQDKEGYLLKSLNAIEIIKPPIWGQAKGVKPEWR
jgi:hypothetical protein